MIKIEELKDKKFESVEDLKEIGYKDNVSITMQKFMIDALINVLVKEDEYGYKTYDSIDKEIAAMVSFASLYTDIELGEDDYDNFDILTECGFAEVVHREYSYMDFLDRIDNRVRDIMRENKIEHAAYKTIDKLTGMVANTLEHVNSMLDKGDPNKIAKYLSKGIEIIAAKMPDFSKVDVLNKLSKEDGYGKA